MNPGAPPLAGAVGADGYHPAVARFPRLIRAALKAAGGRLQPDQRVWLEALRETAAETYLWTPDDWPMIEEVLA
jgi:hypothetical protein